MVPMALNLEILETRETPASDVGGGYLFLAPGVSVHVFEPSWHGPLNVYEGPHKVYVGAGAGGGPRVQVYDKTGQLLQDFFAGDPTSRAGVYFVPTEDHAADPGPYVPPDYGDPSDFTVYVDFETAKPDPWKEQAYRALTDLLAPFPIHVTAKRPDRMPSTYGTVVVGDFTFLHVGGLFPGPTWDTGVWEWMPRQVWVTTVMSGAQAGEAMAHEIGHALGLQHNPGDPNDVMNPTVHVGGVFSPEETAAVLATLARTKKF